jgi:trk system potassium uptake protein TrkH
MGLALGRTRGEKVTHAHALVITALGWLAASFIAAVPLALSGNYASYLDALFDAVSGLTTSGLTVVTDLDHMALAHNMWRHLTHLIGGQGIIVAALSLAVGLRGGAFSLYLAEGRDERILPNVLYTARFIWFVTAVYVSLGTLVLWGVNSLHLGMAPDRGLLHAFWISVAAYDTGGFGPQSMNAMYYHSYLFEFVGVLLMLAGTLNFNLHAQVWRGDRRELWRNIETRVLALNMFLLSVLAAVGLVATRYLPGGFEIVRKGVYHVISANSGTGHQTLYPGQWTTDTGGILIVAVMLAMAAGGAVSSTAGGIKALRIGLIVKSVIHQVKQSIAPRSAVLKARYHHIEEKFLTPEVTGAATTVAILYTVTFITGGLIGAAYGYAPMMAMFESISATANVGLSAGITGVTMPTGLKIVYMVQMWAGRLEFIAVLTLVAHVLLSLGVRRKGSL